jgi:hypothetical protein
VLTCAIPRTSTGACHPQIAIWSSCRRKLGIQENRIDFNKENNMATKGKILVLVSSGHGLPLKDGKVYAGAGY